MLKKDIQRLKEGLIRRAYRLHPRSFYWHYHCRQYPDKPLIARIDDDLKAKVWPGDVLGKSLYVEGLMERQEVRFIKSILKPGMVFFDLGANMGFYSLIAAKRVGSAGQVHSFEPSPRMFEELKFNVELNGFTNVQLNRLALGDTSGTARLSRYERGKEVYGTLSKLICPGEKVIGYDEVTIDTLDNYIKGNGIAQVDVIKIDVEGSEFPVFKGASALLSSSRGPKILFEMAEPLAESFNYTCNEVFEYLETFNYKVITISYGNYAAIKVGEGNGRV